MLPDRLIEQLRNRLIVFWREILLVSSPQKDSNSAKKKSFSSLFSLLLSYLYAWVLHFRYFLYRKKWKKSQRIPLHVISVGNLTVGGAGKTPYVKYLALDLHNKGHKVAIISRGYGRQSKELICIRAPIEKLPTVAEVGDEPHLLMSQLPQINFYIASSRIMAARAALTDGITTVILDDGLQHIALERDENIILIDLSMPLLWEDHLLPAGMLRDLPERLKVATKLILTRTHYRSDDECRKIISYLRLHTQSPIEVMYLFPTHWEHSSTDGLLHYPLEAFKGKRAIVFAGIGNPQQFFRMVEELSIISLKEIAFSDHCNYSLLDIEKTLNDLVSLLDAECFICTTKDIIKLRTDQLIKPCFALHVAVRIASFET